jgi:hypothetical protein
MIKLSTVPRRQMGEWRCYSSIILDPSALGRYEWLASRPGHFTPMRTYWIRASVRLRAGLNAVEKISPLPLIEPRQSSP